MGSHPYLSLDGIVMKRNWGDEVCNVLLLVAAGQDGCREVLGRITRRTRKAGETFSGTSSSVA